MAMNYVDYYKALGHNPQILFFTDGVDEYPVDKCVLDLKHLKQKLKFSYCPINTYGFGMYNDVNTDQLVQIAREFNGMIGYIPDCTNIGTTFVNSIANMLTYAGTNVKLELNF